MCDWFIGLDNATGTWWEGPWTSDGSAGEEGRQLVRWMRTRGIGDECVADLMVEQRTWMWWVSVSEMIRDLAGIEIPAGRITAARRKCFVCEL